MAHPANGRGRLAAVGLLMAALPALRAADESMLPASLPKEQRTNLLRFLKEHEKPDRYVPRGARVVDVAPPAADAEVVATRERPIRQYTVRITPHRPVPGQEKVTRADVYFYRPNPEKGKRGLTVKYTLDLATGKPVGAAEVMTQGYTPVSREEVAEAVAAVKERSATVKKLYQGREAAAVRWEYLQVRVNRKTAHLEPGDRVLRFVFTADAIKDEKAPEPVRVLVNLTRDVIVPDDR